MVVLHFCDRVVGSYRGKCSSGSAVWECAALRSSAHGCARMRTACGFWQCNWRAVHPALIPNPGGKIGFGNSALVRELPQLDLFWQALRSLLVPRATHGEGA